ncbi:type II secretion system F family protein [Pectinatus brassicae]|uniref:Type IV pilus assembly protein PilC n=1 Tax=Pectinatus brassicae TaxID=862415 RepID=A0A840UHB1_9FIRM|nr:type II secretion system F family protein [Pectinatus brassicae]MBB5336506.1 type IV pilus assembly protein PilC [Pectinatus brassicae]
MKKFIYQVKNPQGQNISGQLFAESIDNAIELLYSQKYFILELKEKKKSLFLPPIIVPQRQVPMKIIIAFCRQLSLMLKSGIPLDEAVYAINKQVQNKVFKNILDAVFLQLETGKTLFSSFYRNKSYLPSSLLSLINIGEISGNLDIVLEKTASYLEQDYLAKEKIKTAAIYPFILLSIFFITAFIMFNFVLPIFASLLYSLNVPLPFITKSILFIGDFIANHNITLLLLLCLTIFCSKLLWQKTLYKLLFYKFIFKLPIWGQLILKLNLLQLSNDFSIMLSAGVPIDKTLYTLYSNCQNIYFKNILRQALADVQKGFSLSDALIKHQIFPPFFLQMLITGEKSGNLPQILDQAAAFYQEDVDTAYKRLLAVAEPAMIIILSLLIGAFIIGIALPMFDAATHIPM